MAKRADGLYTPAELPDGPACEERHTCRSRYTNEDLILACTAFIMTGHLRDGGLIDATRSFTVKEV